MSQWKHIGLGDAATFHNGYAFKPSDWSTNGKEIIRIQNLTKGSAQINYFEGELPDKYKVRQGDILISWSGSLGVYEWDGEEAWLNQHLFKVVFDKEELDKTFFKHLISVALQEMEGLVHGATMKHITKQKFDSFQIPLPPLPQQKKIAAILDAADAYRQKTKALIAKYDELTQSLFLDMFGDPVKNEKGWEKTKLEKIGKWQTGGTPSRSKQDYFNGSIPWLSSGELNQMFTVDSKEQITELAIKESNTKIIEVGSLLLGMYDTAALKSTINLVPLTCNQAIAYSRLNEEIANTIYVYHIIQIGKDEFKKLQRGVRQKNLNLSIVKSIEILLPPLTLQNQFAARVKANPD
jgi:type I restriction enzyme S subunit